MSARTLTRHAEMRIAQRGIREEDLELAMWIGTEVEGGIFVREKDCEEIVRQCKQFIRRVLRLKGTRIVVAGGRVVTAYRANRRKEHLLLRR